MFPDPRWLFPKFGLKFPKPRGMFPEPCWMFPKVGLVLPKPCGIYASMASKQVNWLGNLQRKCTIQSPSIPKPCRSVKHVKCSLTWRQIGWTGSATCGGSAQSTPPARTLPGAWPDNTEWTISRSTTWVSSFMSVWNGTPKNVSFFFSNLRSIGSRTCIRFRESFVECWVFHIFVKRYIYPHTDFYFETWTIAGGSRWCTAEACWPSTARRYSYVTQCVTLL